MKNNLLFLSLVFLSLFGLSNCSVSLSGVQVPVGVNTFNVEYIVNSAPLQIPTLSQDVTDGLRTKIEREARLKFNTDKPDIEFSGEITVFEVNSEAPTAGQNTSLNRLDIAVKIDFTNHLDEEANWSSRFSNFANFDPSENLSSVQDELTETILKDIIEDIYQKAFTNW